MEGVTSFGEKFYGRIKTRDLTNKQELLYKTLMPELEIESFTDINISNFAGIYLEIGFGGGEHVAQMAMNNHEDLFIGCEPFVNGIASLLVKIDANNIKNIRIYPGDARTFIRSIPDGVLSGVFLLFPDPWPKRKHIKRRFLQEKTITDIYNKLRIGGFWRLASDHNGYKEWILKLFNQEKFKKSFELKTFDKKNRPDVAIWAKTRYEQKAMEDILYVECIKNGSSNEVD